MKAILYIIFIVTALPNTTSAQETIEKRIVVIKQSVAWGSITRGRANADSFRKQEQLILPPGYTLKSAVIYFTGAGFPTVTMVNINTVNLKEIQHLILKCVPGTVVHIDRILVSGIQGEELFLSSAGFILF